MKVAMDTVTREDVKIGARRWVAERYETRVGHVCGVDCEDFSPTECFERIERAFPNRGLAVSFAKKHPGNWGARVGEQEFDAFCTHYPPVGSWEDVGEWEEIA